MSDPITFTTEEPQPAVKRTYTLCVSGPGSPSSRYATPVDLAAAGYVPLAGDAATEALNAIARACGCEQWEYPGQVVRDVGSLKEQLAQAQQWRRDVLKALELGQDGNAFDRIQDLLAHRDDVPAYEAELALVREQLAQAQAERDEWRTGCTVRDGQLSRLDAAVGVPSHTTWSELAAAAERLRSERDRLQRHYDEAGPEHNLLELLDLYHERMMDAWDERDSEIRQSVRYYTERDSALARLAAVEAALRQARIALARICEECPGGSLAVGIAMGAKHAVERLLRALPAPPAEKADGVPSEFDVSCYRLDESAAEQPFGVSEADERIVDGLLTKAQAGRETRPITRREPTAEQPVIRPASDYHDTSPGPVRTEPRESMSGLVVTAAEQAGGVCPTCRGSGEEYLSDNLYTCRVCLGTGRVAPAGGGETK